MLLFSLDNASILIAQILSEPAHQNSQLPLAPLAACLLFFVTGWAFVSHLGLQNDEALFANGIFKPYAVAYTFRLGHSRSR